MLLKMDYLSMVSGDSPVAGWMLGDLGIEIDEASRVKVNRALQTVLIACAPLEMKTSPLKKITGGFRRMSAHSTPPAWVVELDFPFYQ